MNEAEGLESAIISGIAHDTSEAKATIRGVPDRPGIAARVFRPLADAGVNVDMIVQNVSAEGHTDISFTLPKDDVPPPRRSCARSRGGGRGRVHRDPDIGKVSLIGAGMKSHPGVAADMFDALAEAGVNIEIISTSSIRVSCVVRAADVERAVQSRTRPFRPRREPLPSGTAVTVAAARPSRSDAWISSSVTAAETRSRDTF